MAYLCLCSGPLKISKPPVPPRSLWLGLWLVSCVALSCTKTATVATPNKDQTAYRNRVRVLEKQGDAYHDSGNDSLELIGNQLIALGAAHGDTETIVRGDLFLVNHAWRNSNYTKAMKLAIESLKYARKIGYKAKISQIYATIGNLYKENENYPSALHAAEESAIAARGYNDTGQIIVALLNQGMFTHSYSMRRNDPALRKKSLTFYLEALKLAEGSAAYASARIILYDDLCQYYQLTGDNAQGIRYGQKGVELATKLHKDLSLTYSLNWLGQIYFQQGNRKKGLDYLNRALAIAQKIPNAYRIMEINSDLSGCYASAGHYQEAFRHYYRSVAIRDSLQVEKNVKQIGQMHILYETGRKDQQIESLGLINNERTKETVYMLVGLVLVIVLFVFLSFQYRAIRQRNRLLISGNKTIQEQSLRLTLLMKELHHRVKNNLQIVSSLLSLQSNHLEDPDAKQAVRISQQRIEAMSLIHRNLYQQDNPGMISMSEYVTDLVESILGSFGVEKDRFDLRLDITVTEVDVDIALPLGLIINEWVTNAFKYAYEGIPHPSLYLGLHQGPGITLEIRDNGPGMGRDQWERPGGSFGVKLVKVLTKQLKAECRMEPEGGTRLVLRLPVPPLKKTA